ncbi:MAG: hypothetical protein MZV70_02740 [Desulfobacterales bacterium]|nr:hypothetical protein [Desulfobacterales bacterium]
MGYIKDMILAGFFGATGTADVFFVAFRIPNRQGLFAEGFHVVGLHPRPGSTRRAGAGKRRTGL